MLIYISQNIMETYPPKQKNIYHGNVGLRIRMELDTIHILKLLIGKKKKLNYIKTAIFRRITRMCDYDELDCL